MKKEKAVDINKEHSAPGQLTGYLYQVIMALLVLLENKESETKICIEKFDDIAFVGKDEPITMIQTKHQLNRQGNLINTSVDLWRTLCSWCNAINNSESNLQDTEFIIITTATAKAESAAYYLGKNKNRDYKKALKILLDTTKKNTSTNENFYKSFLSLDSELQKQLIKHTYVFDNSTKINDLKKDIMLFVRCMVLAQHEEKIYEKLIGWWIIKVIECLTSTEVRYISFEQLRNKTVDISNEYKADSLPIDIEEYYNPTKEELESLDIGDKLFIEQLNLISFSNNRLNRCIRDYYNAYRQRSLWIRENLLFVNDLEKYEARLIDEWNRLYLIMEEELDEYGDGIEDEQKIKCGRKLFKEIEDLNLYIREKVTTPFIMRGTYHGLANKLKVGWHIDFMNRLSYLLKG